ncbi:hypothetical protein HPB50_025488 [Hyalomma asiaticum]|uniref:Uncharacterized protein n=1 Tax=Hyalomma asiaticum TaxID=266040 RepID=A0ACB7SJ22_HYAAI|nr:hypothetical protein HPB50_025488 [Hyalomma asiaticum]
MNLSPQLLHSRALYRILGRLASVIELFHAHEKLGSPSPPLICWYHRRSDIKPRSAHLLVHGWEMPAGITDDCPWRSISLIWTPAHAGLSGNEEAHSLARGLTFRAGEIEPPLQAEERLLSFHHILAYYRDERRVYAPPASSLTTNSPLHANFAANQGIFCTSSSRAPPSPIPPSLAVAASYWDSIMNSTSTFVQRKVISCAMKRIALQGLSCVL